MNLTHTQYKHIYIRYLKQHPNVFSDCACVHFLSSVLPESSKKTSPGLKFKRFWMFWARTRCLLCSMMFHLLYDELMIWWWWWWCQLPMSVTDVNYITTISLQMMVTMPVTGWSRPPTRSPSRPWPDWPSIKTGLSWRCWSEMLDQRGT